ncbi:uncharacterized DUF497 family protein [Fontibacillus solani]|uniref:Uncharacterized DUF497 family protein n=1 Tax=Fontibacillus solani TaxID=1572857 RepID=A0A7W3SUN3_9BACL|nr:DUF4258 domain-containing protein [Fontibacillus solani]MBA9086576.1 uncharacterized DUF497 family protein [Fontibacillus solani]
MDEELLLETIKQLGNKGSYRLTRHAVEQRVKRCMSIEDIEDILKNPMRIIRTDEQKDGNTYKIEGGFNKKRLAIKFMDMTIIVVITAMD